MFHNALCFSMAGTVMSTRLFELGELTMARSERLIPRAGANETSVTLAHERVAVQNWSWAGAHESCPGRRVEPASRAKQRLVVVARPRLPASAQCRVDTSFPAEERETHVSPRGAPPPDVTLPGKPALGLPPGGGERGDYPEARTGRAFIFR